MSDPVTIALIAGVVSTVTSTIAAIVSLVNQQRLKGVQIAVNGGLTDAKNEIVELKTEIARLNQILN